jgi:hypothetical protein
MVVLHRYPSLGHFFRDLAYGTLGELEPAIGSDWVGGSHSGANSLHSNAPVESLVLPAEGGRWPRRPQGRP